MTAHQSALTRLLDWAAGQIASIRMSYVNHHTGEIDDEEIREEVKQVEADIAALSVERPMAIRVEGLEISPDELRRVLDETPSRIRVGYIGTVNWLAHRQWEWVERMGWHNKTPLEYMAVIGSEVGEATNECRGEVPSERVGEELADIVLRVGDMSVEYGIDLQGEIDRKMAINEQRGTRGRAK